MNRTVRLLEFSLVTIVTEGGCFEQFSSDKSGDIWADAGQGFSSLAKAAFTAHLALDHCDPPSKTSPIW